METFPDPSVLSKKLILLHKLKLDTVCCSKKYVTANRTKHAHDLITAPHKRAFFIFDFLKKIIQTFCAILLPKQEVDAGLFEHGAKFFFGGNFYRNNFLFEIIFFHAY